MKTTLEIPDSIFRRAKSAAAERGIPFRTLVSEALADKLRSQANGATWSPAHRMVSCGGLESGVGTAAQNFEHAVGCETHLPAQEGGRGFARWRFQRKAKM
jgi:hypothetical protein